jgi:three-Cys-motif partner protein
MIYAVCAFCNADLDRDESVCRECGADNDTTVDDSVIADLSDVELDRLNPWSKVKHEIVEKYLGAYTTILRNQGWARRYVYIDAFAGAGVAIDSESEELIAAGALRALEVQPRFSEYHFIDTNRRKLTLLERLAHGRPEVHIHHGDYRAILPGILAERCRYEDYARGLCILDPYGLSVDYVLLQQIAATNSVEIFFNFMLLGANRNVLWNRDPAELSPKRRALMTRIWGNDQWPEELYEREPSLFGDVAVKVSNERVVEAYRKRLRAAGFKEVPEPIAMKNRTNAPLYYLFFGSQNRTAARIASEVMARYGHR